MKFEPGKSLEDFISAQIVSGRFQDADAVLRAGLTLLKDAQMSDTEYYGSLIEESRQRGGSVPAEEVLDTLAQKYRRMAEPRDVT